MQMRASALIAALVLSLAASAQTYPTKPVRVILPFPPGEGPDLILRRAGDDLQQRLGQAWVVENRPGGNMIVAANACLGSAPDGHTICMVNGSMLSVNPHVMAKLPYDPDRDFKPITAMYFLVGGLFANSSMPASNVKDFIAHARTKPGAINYGSLGPNSTTDVFRMWLNEAWQTNIVGIPYKGGAQIIPALVAGEIDFTWIGVFNALGQIKAGKVKLYAVDSRKRSPLYPDVPTLTEVGLPESPLASWHGLAFQSAAPDTAARRINAEFARLFSEPKFAAFLSERLVENAVTSPEEFAAFLKRDRERVGELVRKFNIPKQ
jgi:tripartite-type tricarboxylate transporter receptor subunit TctC